MNRWRHAGVCLLVLVLCLGLLCITGCAAKEDDRGQPETEATSEALESPDETGEEVVEADSGCSIPVAAIAIAAGGLTAAALIVVLVVVLRRKRKQVPAASEPRHMASGETFVPPYMEDLTCRPQSLKDPPRQPVQYAATADATIRMQRDVPSSYSTTGYMLAFPNGSIVPINTQVVTIGRDPGCTIPLDAQARGVSRRHARLELREGIPVLIDLDSTNGTFVRGKRLPARTPVALSRGSSFSLGGENNRFTIC